MARKKRTPTPPPSLPLSKGEIWEVGRRSLSVHVLELAQRGERPEIFLAVQAGEEGGVLLAEPVTSAQPWTALGDFTLQAMRHPLLGPPRRPEMIRIASQPEAESLAVALAGMGLALEVCHELHALDLVHSELEREFSGITHDYRSQAAQAGELLSEAGLQAFFRAARQLYREEMWQSYSDDTLFEIVLDRARGAAQTYYGILMGSMGTEFGLVLYPSLEALQQFYDASRQHLEHFDARTRAPGRHPAGRSQIQRDAELVAHFTQIPAVSLTYTPQSDVPPALLQEAKQFKLPLASKSAFPLVIRMGDHGFHLATSTELLDVFLVIQAILDWDARIDDAAGDDEIDITLTLQIPAVAGFAPVTTARTTLRRNPCLLAAVQEEADVFTSDLDALFQTLFKPMVAPKTATTAKKSGAKASGKTSRPAGKHAVPPASARVYTLDVHLVDGPMSAAHAKRDISRRIAIRGEQTLHELHEAIFQAFGRWEEHLYEFNLGLTPMDRSQIYSAYGEWEAENEEPVGNAVTTSLDVIHLEVGRRFGYLFDMGDNWAHVIEVVSMTDSPGRGKYPRVVKKVGPSPPQYPDAY